MVEEGGFQSKGEEGEKEEEDIWDICGRRRRRKQGKVDWKLDVCF